MKRDAALITQAARAAMAHPPQAHRDNGPSSVWALGDYHRFAREFMWGFGPLLVQACGIGPRQRVLDVAAGTGNVAIRAAQAGAEVVACDLTPENFAAGRDEARAAGVTIDWRAADAQQLPFPDADFDVVTSSFGAIFAANHQQVADELVRVCRPGGTIGLLAFTSGATGGPIFDLLGPYLPALPVGAVPPILWGDEQHVRDLFGARVQLLEMRRGIYTERAASPSAYCAFYNETFGPVVAIRAGARDQVSAFDRDFLQFAATFNRGAPDGPAECPYEYLLIRATR